MELEAFCSYPWTRARITSEGKLAMCCYQRHDIDRPDREPYLGNVLEQNFDSIWFSNEAQKIRQSVLEGKIHSKCDCSGCPYRKMSVRPSQTFVYNEYPVHLEIDLPNTHCNIGGRRPSEMNPACIMCERASPAFEPEKDRLIDVLERISHLLPNLEQIHLQGNAEPFWCGLIFDVLDALEFDQYKHQITVSTITNGVFLNEKVCHQWLSKVPHSVTVFSLDAATSETYKKIRILDVYDDVVANLKFFSGKRVNARQFVQIVNNINTINLGEVIGMCETASESDVDLIEFCPTDGFNKAIMVNKDNCGLFAKAQHDISEYCSQNNIPFRIIQPLDMGLTTTLALRVL